MSEDEIVRQVEERVEEKIDTEIELQFKKLRYERAIALRSLWGGFLMTFGIIGVAWKGDATTWERIVEIQGLLEWGVIMMFSLPGAFMGIKAWAEKR